MFFPIKIKIRIAVLIIVLLFASFTLFYFPKQQADYLLKSYNTQVQNLANTVALGIEIALNDDNFKGVETAMGYVKGKPDFLYVSLLQSDTIWNDAHSNYTIKQTVFKTFPDNANASAHVISNDSTVVKEVGFNTALMNGSVLLAFSTHEINENKKSIRNTSLTVSACILLVGMLISFWLSKNISKPVEELSNAAQKVGRGDLSPVVTAHSNDELGNLANVFNNMVRDLSKTQQELSSTNSTLSSTNHTLKSTLSDLQSTQAQLIQAEKMASLGELTAGIAHEIQNPLNFVNNFAEINRELIDELKAEREKTAVERDGSLEEELFNDLDQNLSKITFHGRRADAIVKGMLQHSRKNTGQKELTDINALCDEYLRLSYHGLRARDKTFNAEFKTGFDNTIGKINVLPQDIGRVLLNMFNNAFYATSEKQKAQSLTQEEYKPLVSVNTRKTGDKINIEISDNGNGIPKHLLDKIFQPFFTTKPTGEGTGLGLSLAYDIITKEHYGSITVESKEGVGTVFLLELPIEEKRITQDTI